MRVTSRLIRGSLLPATAVLVSSCSFIVEKADGPPAKPADISSIPDAIPRDEPRSKYGNPDSYVVNGKRYRLMVRDQVRWTPDFQR